MNPGTNAVQQLSGIVGNGETIGFFFVMETVLQVESVMSVRGTKKRKISSSPVLHHKAC